MENPVYLIFGPEDDGLSNEEMRLCHHVCRLPTLGEITSLNLSHAVLLAVYLAQAARIRFQSTAEETPKFEPGPVYYPSQTIHRWLEALGFDLSSKRVNIEHTLNRFFLSHCPSPEELRLVDKVLRQTIRKLAD
jgi:tRNA/rRNA methyltransferase